jgi:hypothetical protein
MKGRWTIIACDKCRARWTDEDATSCWACGAGDSGEQVEAVPCDDAAIERAIEAVNRAHESKIDSTWRELLTVAFRAAGDTP